MKRITLDENKSGPKSKLFALLWPFIRCAPLGITLLMLLPLLSGSIFLVVGLLQQAFFDRLSAPINSRGDHRSTIFWAVMAILVANLALQVVRYIVEYLRSVSVVKIHLSITSLLQHNLLEQVLQHPRGQTAIGSIGEIINIFDEDTNLAIMFFSRLGNMISPIVLGIAAFVILSRVNILITLFVVLPLACTSVIVEKLRRHISTMRIACREASSTLTGSIGEIFRAVQSIKVVNSEKGVMNHFNLLSDHRRVFEVRDCVLSSILHALFNGLSGLGIGLVLLATSLCIQQGYAFRTGDLVLFTTYLIPIIEMVAVLGHCRAEYIQSAVSLERLAQLQQEAPVAQLLEGEPMHRYSNRDPFLLTEPAAKTPQDCLETLEVNDLTYHYPGSERGIQHINLRLTRGSLTVITGQVGAGKSTLLRVLLGLLPKESGEIRWNGQLVSDPSTFFVPPRSAYKAQIPHLFSDSLKDNILLGLQEVRADLPQAVHMSVLERDVMMQEQGLDTPVGAHGAKLSSSQIQRIAAARMWVRDAELLIFDEISSVLDVETEKILWERLLAGDKQRTYLIVSHSKTLLQLADQIIIMKDGQVVDQDDSRTVLATNEARCQLWQRKSEEAMREEVLYLIDNSTGASPLHKNLT